MEPQIQYANTSDGVRIAFAVFGAGPPLVWCPDAPWTHLQYRDEAALKGFEKPVRLHEVRWGE